MRYQLTMVRKPIIKKSTNKKCWRGCRENRTLLHCWWECKLIQPLWKRVWRVLKKLGIKLPFFVVLVQLLSHVRLWDPMDCSQASLSFTISWSLLKLTSIELVMPSNHLILCYPLLLLPSIFPSNTVFSKESALHIRWPKYWPSLLKTFNIDPMKPRMCLSDGKK